VRLLPSTSLALLAAWLALPAHAVAQVAPPAQPETPPPPAPELKVERPGGRPLVREGQDGRLLLGGRWYFRQDDGLVGEEERWYAQRDLEGWTALHVPHSWNATDLTQNRPTVGWYRKELSLPPAPRGVRRFWKVRFEGVNYRSTVWLNGRRLGAFTGYFPFELDLTNLRRGRNTLVVRVSTLRSRTDLTHWRPAAFNGYGSGGWWNSGGLLREVYVRAVDTVDVEGVRALPHLRCLGCPARVDVRTVLRNLTAKDRDVTLTYRLRGSGVDETFRGRPETVLGRGRRELTRRITIDRPRLWQPGRPALYSLAVSAASGRPARTRGTYRLSFGVRKLESRRGVLYLNGRRLQLRGASVHEDDIRTGAALTPGTRSFLVRRLRDLGATVTRSHYPLHPAFIEALDRAGILYWVQAPVYQLPNEFFARRGVRDAATRAVRLTVANDVNHASIFTWSLANEPAGNRSELGVIGRGLRTYIRDAAAAAREIDDTRLIAIDRQSRVGEPLTSPAYRHLDALGVNEYFGWYDSYRADLQRPPTTTAELGPFLDSLHAANPRLPLVVTEFGAEASRAGPVTQPGTFEFQTRFTLDHLAVHASKRYVAGSIVWALRDFRVEPSWQGGAPAAYATPPWHNKSLLDQTNARKPVYFEVRKHWRRTRPLR
jgi:beta-galactosidase/beta-glucuronidase